MTHLSELQISMFADGALLPEEQSAIKQHCDSCAACQSQLNELILEAKIIDELITINSTVKVSAFHQPARLRDLALFGTIIGFGVCLLVILWQSLQSDLSREVFSWFSSVHVTDVNRIVISTVLFIFQEGTTMFDALFSFILYGLLLLGLVFVMLSKPKFRGAVSACFAVLLVGGLFTSPEANATEYRRGDQMITIEASETIDDTLVVAGNTAVIDGTVNGDLIVFGNRVIVNGKVTGNLIVFTNTVTISGHIGGSIMSFSNSLEIADALVDRDLWGFSNNTTINGVSSISGNATIFTNIATIAGEVGRDLTAFGQSIEISGKVEDDVEAFVQTISLIGDAYVGGNVRFRANNENALKQSPSAVIMGTIEHIAGASRPMMRNKFSTIGFYTGQILRIFCAFIVGMAFFWFFPALRNVSLRGGVEGLKTGAIGLLTLICTPIIAVLCAITIIGLPFAMVGLFSYIVGLYLAKIVLALVIGRLVLASSEKRHNHLWALVAGLVVILVVVNLPWVGGTLGFVMILVGLGLIVQQILAYTASLETK